jgi:hypothetical protein
MPRPEDAGPPDPEQVARPFDPIRDPNERVRRDDWYPTGPEHPRFEIDLDDDTVQDLRRHYLTLRELGLL